MWASQDNTCKNGKKDKITPMYLANKIKRNAKDCILFKIDGNHFAYLKNSNYITSNSTVSINFESGFLYEIHEILHGNLDDDFGTYRIFLWKRSISLIKDYPIIGTGPDTFAVRFMDKYTQDVAQLGEITINDTAANNYLTILVNIGIIGLVSYLAFLILQLIYAIKKGNIYSMVLFIAFICFIIQDFFNLWVVITIPIFWVLMSLIFISIKNKCTNETEEKNEK